MKKILLVEDNFYLRDIYRIYLEKEGFEVHLAVDGFEGMNKAKDTTYDMILLDIVLPKANGLSVLKTIRHPGGLNFTTAVFMLTNLGQDDVIEETFKIGADGYLIKVQIEPKILIAEINTFFSKQEELRNTSNSPSQR